MILICSGKLESGGICGRAFVVPDAAGQKHSQHLCPTCRTLRARVGHRAMVQKRGYGRIPKRPGD